MTRKSGRSRVLRAALSALMLGLASPLIARAEPSAVAHREIGQLLEYIERSGCEFNRNGTWHQSGTAQAHLRGKYEYLAKRNLITAAEDFIAMAATKSSLTGDPYEVRCSNHAPVASDRWLGQVLASFRARP